MSGRQRCKATWPGQAPVVRQREGPQPTRRMLPGLAKNWTSHVQPYGGPGPDCQGRCAGQQRTSGRDYSARSSSQPHRTPKPRPPGYRARVAWSSTNSYGNGCLVFPTPSTSTSSMPWKYFARPFPRRARLSLLRWSQSTTRVICEGGRGERGTAGGHGFLRPTAGAKQRQAAATSRTRKTAQGMRTVAVGVF